MKKSVPRNIGTDQVNDQGEKNDEIRTGITAVDRNRHSQIQKKVIDENLNEQDYEGDMAIGELKAIAAKATEIANMLNTNTELEGWVQGKITKAKDYITSVHDYMKYHDTER
jgi:hypothetical protein